MNGRFILKGQGTREELDWGVMEWIAHPPNSGAQDLTFIRVTLTPGGGHDFHKHPDQEEVIYVNKGQITQWLEDQEQVLQPGEAIYIPKGVVHASFNADDASEDAEMLVVLGPCVGELGYETVDVSGEAPWASLRAK